MTVENPAPVVPNVDPSKGLDPTPEPKSPSYESYQKLLGEKKSASAKLKESQDELAALKKDKANAVEQKLLDDGKLKEAFDLKSEELAAANKRLDAQETERADTKKLRSFFKALGSDVDEKYWNLIDIDKIIIEDGQVNEFSVSKYVEDFKGSFPEVVTVKEKRKMPGDQPPAGSGTGTLSIDEWNTLPRKDKEARINDVKLN